MVGRVIIRNLSTILLCFICFYPGRDTQVNFATGNVNEIYTSFMYLFGFWSVYYATDLIIVSYFLDHWHKRSHMMIIELKLLVARLLFVNGFLSSTTHLHWITKAHHETSIMTICWISCSLTLQSNH
eukprot:scaffold13441_cov81-Amphora_coffeaeformis.AAC.1